MFKVFVLSASGVFVQHGPVRASEKQSVSVARSLSRRLGWVAVSGVVPPAVPAALPAGLPSDFLAGLSPVWKDPGLAARWAAGGRAAVAPPSLLLVGPVAPSVAAGEQLVVLA